MKKKRHIVIEATPAVEENLDALVGEGEEGLLHDAMESYGRHYMLLRAGDAWRRRKSVNLPEGFDGSEIAKLRRLLREASTWIFCAISDLEPGGSGVWEKGLRLMQRLEREGF